MTLSSTRGLVRASMNLGCHGQAAMVAEREDELKFYRRITGTDFPGEYGERLSARRRGSKFETNLHRNDAAGLRDAVAPLFGYDSVAMWVRNLADEVPGPPTTMRAARLSRMRAVLRDLAAGRPVPELIIQPQFRLYVGPSAKDAEYVSPDAVVLDPARRMYLPLEEKSFIVRDGVADGADLNLSRRQAATQILALREEADRVGLAERVGTDALFVFALPWGLTAAAPVGEHLEQELFEIARAVELVREVRVELAALRGGTMVALENLFDDLPFRFRDGCASTCIMATRCKEKLAGTARLLGDSAAEVLGEGAALHRVVDLMRGAPAGDEAEQRLKARLQDALAILGITA